MHSPGNAYQQGGDKRGIYAAMAVRSSARRSFGKQSGSRSDCKHFKLLGSCQDGSKCSFRHAMTLPRSQRYVATVVGYISYPSSDAASAGSRTTFQCRIDYQWLLLWEGMPTIWGQFLKGLSVLLWLRTDLEDAKRLKRWGVTASKYYINWFNEICVQGVLTLICI